MKRGADEQEGALLQRRWKEKVRHKETTRSKMRDMEKRELEPLKRPSVI